MLSNDPIVVKANPKRKVHTAGKKVIGNRIPAEILEDPKLIQDMSDNVCHHSGRHH